MTTESEIAESQSLPREPETFALLIAIDTYKFSPSIPTLHGCVNDAEDFRHYLTEGALAVPPQNIRTLFNESATRDNILTAFTDHFINNESVIEGDLFFFFYAGHGDSVEAPGWNTDGRKVETICPYDVTAFQQATPPLTVDGDQSLHAADTKYGIPDRTINALMRHLAKKKGDNIVAIFDCCHSGGLFRDAVSSRSLHSVPPRLPLPLNLDRELFEGVFDTTPTDSARGIDLVLPSGFAYSGTKSHVLLAACQPKEKAREATFEGKQRGRFTYHLLRYLRDIATLNHPPMTYATLVEGVSKYMAQGPNAEPVSRGTSGASDPIGQHPLCEGRYKHRILFSTEEEARANSFPLAYMPVQPGQPQKGDALYVVAGSIQGVNENTQFMYRHRIPNTTAFETVTHITLQVVPDTVETDRSQLRAIGTSGDLAPQTALEKRSLPEHAMVTVSTWGLKSMRVWCARGVPLAVPRETARFERAAHSKLADVYCYEDRSNGSERKYIFKRRDPLSLLFTSATPKLSWPTPITEDATILDAIAKFNFHLYHHNESADVRQDLQFDVRIHPLRRRNGGLHQIYEIAGGPESDLLANASPHHLPTRHATYHMCGDDVKEAIVTGGECYGFTVVNRSDFNVFVYFDPADYSIAVWYHPSNETQAPLAKGSELAIGYGTDFLEVFQITSTRAETAFVKIVVSNVYVDMGSVAQKSPLYQAGERGMVTMVAIPVLSGWNSAIYALTAHCR